MSSTNDGGGAGTGTGSGSAGTGPPLLLAVRDAIADACWSLWHAADQLGQHIRARLWDATRQLARRDTWL